MAKYVIEVRICIKYAYVVTFW